MKTLFHFFTIIAVVLLSASKGQPLTHNEIGDIAKIKDAESIEQKISSLENIKEKSEDQKTMLVILYHNYTKLKKDIDTTEAMIEKTEQFDDIIENNQIAQLYYGSMLTLVGRDSINPVKRIYYVNKGTKIIDKAVSKNDSTPMARIVRAMNGIDLPTFFNRKKIAMNDMEWIIEQEKNEKKIFNKETMAEVYYKLAEGYKKSGNTDKAVSLWEECTQKYEGTIFAKEAIKMLDIYKD